MECCISGIHFTSFSLFLFRFISIVPIGFYRCCDGLIKTLFNNNNRVTSIKLFNLSSYYAKEIHPRSRVSFFNSSKINSFILIKLIELTYMPRIGRHRKEDFPVTNSPTRFASNSLLLRSSFPEFLNFLTIPRTQNILHGHHKRGCITSFASVTQGIHDEGCL